MTIPNRKTVRSAFASNIATYMKTGSNKLLQEVWKSRPKSFDGLSPVCYVMTMPSKYSLLSGGTTQNIDYVVVFAARIDGAVGSGMDTASADDALDDAHYYLCLMLKAIYSAEFIRESIPDIEEPEDGAVYLSEAHYVRLLQVNG